MGLAVVASIVAIALACYRVGFRRGRNSQLLNGLFAFERGRVLGRREEREHWQYKTKGEL